MNNISIFKFHMSNVRILLKNDEIWFCQSDVLSSLTISNRSDILKKLNPDGCVKNSLTDNLGRVQLAIFINEPNLYRLIFRSNKQKAVEFQNWIFEEVLPSIRKTGKYAVKDSPYPLRLKSYPKELQELKEKYKFTPTDERILDYCINKAKSQGYAIGVQSQNKQVAAVPQIPQDCISLTRQEAQNIKEVLRWVDNVKPNLTTHAQRMLNVLNEIKKLKEDLNYLKDGMFIVDKIVTNVLEDKLA